MKQGYELFYREITTGIIFHGKRITPNDFSLINPTNMEEIKLSLHQLRKRFVSEKINKSLKPDPVRRSKSFYFYE